jgi:hypothetical protein
MTNYITTSKKVLFGLLVLLLCSCQNSLVVTEKVIILPINQLSDKPTRADFVSIDEKTFSNLVSYLNENAINDTNLINNPNAILITSAFEEDGNFLIHPPLTSFSKLMPLEVNIKDGILKFKFKCPKKFADACECANNPDKPRCPRVSDDILTDEGSGKRCRTNILVPGLPTPTGLFDIICKPGQLCSGSPPFQFCETRYDFIKTNSGFKSLVIECYCK